TLERTSRSAGVVLRMAARTGRRGHRGALAGTDPSQAERSATRVRARNHYSRRLAAPGSLGCEHGAGSARSAHLSGSLADTALLAHRSQNNPALRERRELRGTCGSVVRQPREAHAPLAAHAPGAQELGGVHALARPRL